MSRSQSDDGNEFVHVDEHNLDEEWKQQPALYHRYARKLADARHKEAECKADLEVTCAELERAIRATPERYGVSKVTEALVEATVKVQAEYQRAVKAYNDARYNVGILSAAVDALSHKKSALENLVSLWARDYFSTPRLKGDDDLKAREKQKEMTEARPRWRRDGK